jgi:hypothetical protein
MKNQSLLLIILLFTTLCKAQETKKIKNSIGEKIEILHVLKSNPEIKHGEYLLTWNWKFYHSISKEGKFENNQKQGIWKEYYRFRGKYNKTDMRVKYQTSFKNDKKNGVFIEFDYNKDTLQMGSFIENKKTGIWKKFENKKLTEHYDYTNNINLARTENNKTTKVDVLPKLIDLDLNTFLMKNLKPVNHKKKKNLFGEIEITMIITKTGTVQEIEISGAEYPELETEFRVAISNSSEHWEPALKNGEKVDVKVLIPANFLIEWKRKKFRVGMNAGNMKQVEQ